ncbi:cell surface protein [Soonwooa sp.]|uniref:cell surface protein n=1 Tax=Soonwooa sp. TaxID=1938592 RepID=UPI002624045D|nr:cell surface protein [Soonwooa sp.]
MKKNAIKILTLGFASSLLVGLVACKSDREEFDNGEVLPENALDSQYSTNRYKVLDIDSRLKTNTKLTWSIRTTKLVDTTTVAYDSIVAENVSKLEFISRYSKDYALTLTAERNGNTKKYETHVIVNKEPKTYSKYISDVFDFKPAVGQFINEIPEYATGDTQEKMIKKAKESIVGGNATMITLGGFGGYVVFGFDHTIPNYDGRDFKILGNAFWANDAIEERTGSCEPGIIMVAYDRNKNGKPDEDEWYEIAGSEYFKDTTIKNYEITYFKPDENKTPVPGSQFWQTDTEYIKWQDNLGNSGFKTRNTFHAQSYYPLWFSELSYKLRGTRLKDNFYDQSGTGNYWVGKSYAYGYADNAPNDDDASNIDISWAVDKYGNYVKLPGIDFVKVYTGINQEAGWLGEVSTEVAGAYDLHFK